MGRTVPALSVLVFWCYSAECRWVSYSNLPLMPAGWIPGRLVHGCQDAASFTDTPLPEAEEAGAGASCRDRGAHVPDQGPERGPTYFPGAYPSNSDLPRFSGGRGPELQARADLCSA